MKLNKLSTGLCTIALTTALSACFPIAKNDDTTEAANKKYAAKYPKGFLASIQTPNLGYAFLGILK
jgi:hypothetical protein